MKPMAVILGIGAGLVGAIVWAVISYYAHVQLGFLAWGIGVVVGIGVARGSKGETNAATGVIAAVIALVSVLGGKYFTAWALAGDLTHQITQCDDNTAKVTLAESLVNAAEKAGQTVQWPAGKDAESADEIGDYPPDIAEKATGQWAAMSEEERSKFRADYAAHINAGMSGMRGTIAMSAFERSFTIFSIVFCAFAVLSAFRIGSGGKS